MIKYAIGIDLGGTFIKAGAVSESGEILVQLQTSTRSAEGPEVVVAQISDLVEKLENERGPKDGRAVAVGAGVPGLIKIAEGVVAMAPNLSGWRDVPLRKLLEDRLGRPVSLENDANAAAWGESWVGAGRGVRSLVLLTLGTGIGGGIVVNNQVWHGSSDTAAEFGHMVIVADGALCGCGQRGHLEAYASAPATVRRFRAAVESGKPSSLASVVAAGGDLSTKRIYDAAKEGDALAQEIFKETARFLALGVVNLMHIINPELVLLAGGMIAAGEMLIKPLREEVARIALETPRDATKIAAATLAGGAGIIGTAGLAFRALGADIK